MHQQCFGNGTIRSVKELWQLLDENNITLKKGSASFANWKSGVDEYMRANYVASADSFGKSRDYGYNRWAEPVQKLARTNQGTQYDTSFMNQLQVVMVVALVVLIIVTILLAIAFVIHRRRINMLQVGHYGAAANAQATSPTGTTPPPLPIMNAGSPSTPATPMYGQSVAPAQPQAIQQVPAPQPMQQQPIQPQPPVRSMDGMVLQSQPPQVGGPVQPHQLQQSQTPPSSESLSGPVPPSEDPFYK